MNESYAAPTAEYSKLLKLLDGSGSSGGGDSGGDVYSQLLEKEQNALVTVNRVVEHETGKAEASKLFYNMSLLSIIAVFANTWKNIFLELAVHQDFKDVISVWHIFSKKGRKIYVGMMVAFVGFFIYLVDMSS